MSDDTAKLVPNEYFDDGDTILRVDWDEPDPMDSTNSNQLRLYARWQEKSYKVQYYKGTADRVAFHLVRRLTPKNGGNWESKNVLESGDRLTLCQYVQY